MTEHSEFTIVLKSLDSWGVFSEWLEYVTAVSSVSCSLFLLRVGISFSENILSSCDVLLHHFAHENVVDFNIMCRESVVKETWWEHDVISLEPEMSEVLLVEFGMVLSTLEFHSTQDHAGDKEVAEESTIVQWTVAEVSKESRSDWSHDSVGMEDLNDHPVHNSESLVEVVLTVFSLSNLNSLEDSSDKTWSSGKSFVNQILETFSVFQEEVLKSMRHIFNLIFIIYNLIQ